MEIFSPANGGFRPSLNWYKAQIANLNTPDEEGISEERKQIGKPTLLVTCAFDGIAVPELQVEGMRPFCRELKVVEFESGHFVQMEKAEEVNRCLEDFIEGR